MKSTVKTVSPLDKIARKHGISGDELKAELEKDKQREKRNKRKIKQKEEAVAENKRKIKQKEEEVAENKRKRMENLLTVRLPMDCVNYIIGFMDPTVRFEIDRLLTQDKIERVEVILSMMESEEILKHMIHGKLRFIIDESNRYTANLSKKNHLEKKVEMLEQDRKGDKWKRWMICNNKLDRLTTKFWTTDYYTKSFNESIREIYQDSNTIMCDKKYKGLYEIYTKYYPDDNAIEKVRKVKMCIGLKDAFKFLHDRNQPKEVHQRLDKMLNIIMRLPKKFTLDQPKSIKSWSRY